MKIIILAGGGGTRLYPLSTPDQPKQFLPLADGKPLLVNTITRFLGLCEQQDVLVVTGKRYIKLTSKLLRLNNLGKVNVIGEPCARNTAPAIALGVKYIVDKLKCAPNEPIFVAPSDHVIAPADSYIDYVKLAIEGARGGRIVTLGLEPTSAETGYGYIRAASNGQAIRDALEFREKPDKITAQKYVDSKQYFWNAGMFCFVYSTFDSELQTNASDLYNLYKQGYQSLFNSFGSCPSISIDYALAEKSKNISVVPCKLSWSDIGSWDAYYDYCDKSPEGNVIIGKARAVDCKGCLVASYDGSIQAVEQSDMIIISANGVTVTMPRGSSQRIKELQ